MSSEPNQNKTNYKIRVNISLSEETVKTVKEKTDNEGFCLSRDIEAHLKKKFNK